MKTLKRMMFVLVAAGAVSARAQTKIVVPKGAATIIPGAQAGAAIKPVSLSLSLSLPSNLPNLPAHNAVRPNGLMLNPNPTVPSLSQPMPERPMPRLILNPAAPSLTPELKVIALPASALAPTRKEPEAAFEASERYPLPEDPSGVPREAGDNRQAAPQTGIFGRLRSFVLNGVAEGSLDAAFDKSAIRFGKAAPRAEPEPRAPGRGQGR